jgi:hypothetical protein
VAYEKNTRENGEYCSCVLAMIKKKDNRAIDCFCVCIAYPAYSVSFFKKELQLSIER